MVYLDTRDLAPLPAGKILHLLPGVVGKQIVKHASKGGSPHGFEEALFTAIHRGVGGLLGSADVPAAVPVENWVEDKLPKRGLVGALPISVWGRMDLWAAVARRETAINQLVQHHMRVVQAAKAYEHHRREGDTHYIGFVDTRKLLESRKIGKILVGKLVDVVHKSGNRPAVLLAPHRSPARILAAKMSRAFEAVTGVRPRIVEATQKRTTGEWAVSPDGYITLFDADVLVVDTAASHGRTLDQLATLAGRAKARRIGGAVLLSRLTPPCEDAFNLRLNGGYHRLFNLPIRPVAIRGDRVDLCPVCRHRNAIRQFAKESDIDAVEHWATGLLKARRGPQKKVFQPQPRQLTLSECEKAFLTQCRAAVTSGVTLHALGTASTNRSAPLILPELFDDAIPVRVRAAMVENLPAGVLEWTGGTLVSDLLRFLSSGINPSIWKAIATLLSREGNGDWIGCPGSLLSRLPESGRHTSQSFWNQMACNAYLLAAGRSDFRAELQGCIDALLATQTDNVVQNGLRQMQEVVCKASQLLPT
jgi:hypothetical protein